MLPAIIANGNFIAQKVGADVSLHNVRQVEKLGITNDLVHLLTHGWLDLGGIELQQILDLAGVSSGLFNGDLHSFS
jgi:hypothetical protein